MDTPSPTTEANDTGPEAEAPCPHENQYVTDRYLFACKDCGEELGR